MTWLQILALTCSVAGWAGVVGYLVFFAAEYRGSRGATTRQKPPAGGDWDSIDSEWKSRSGRDSM